MISIFYLWNKILKKIKGSAIRNSKIHCTSKIEAGSHIINSVFGRYSFCGYDCSIINCSVGSFCSIANNVVIGGAMHPITWVSTSPVFYNGRDSVRKKFSKFRRPEDKATFIGNDVWIGQNVIIKQGVRIGNGAVVGMGSVVTKDVLPYAIVAGNPAKVIKYRFSVDIINGLEKSHWWDLDDKELRSVAEYIKDPVVFLDKINKYFPGCL